MEGFGRADYFDSYKVAQSADLSVDKIATEIFRMSDIVAVLMKIRDRIVRLFGLAASGNEAPERNYYPVGSRLMIFTVSARNENEIVMEEDDKHLKFRTSVLVDREKSEVYLTTVVKYNSWGGRLYFIPVKPVHKIIVPLQLNRAQYNSEKRVPLRRKFCNKLITYL
ncbi:MAG: DUF2867 domain-containing protein [Prevotellaceae bacterium]|nr:DUF2867 domain-containing protein [Prevotellaceae bacterium]